MGMSTGMSMSISCTREGVLGFPGFGLGVFGGGVYLVAQADSKKWNGRPGSPLIPEGKSSEASGRYSVLIPKLRRHPTGSHLCTRYPFHLSKV